MQLLVNEHLTMSSREIADLLGKNHSDIKRSAQRLEAKGLMTQPLADTPYTDNQNGQTYFEYRLNKRDSLVLVAQNSPEFTAAIVDRWQELENQYKPQIPQTYHEALRLAADQAEQLALQAPKVQFVDNLVDRKNLLTATQVGQKHKISAVKLNKLLDELGVYNKSVKRGRAFKQWFIDKGFGEMKKTEMGFDQCLFTNAGDIWVNEKLITEGVI